MRLHIQTSSTQSDTVPQVLQVEHDNRLYHFSLLHATLNQRYPGKNWCKFREHTHDVYHIVLYTKGEDVLLLEGQRHNVTAGSLALISPRELHDVAGYRDKEIVYSEVTFEFIDAHGTPLILPFHELLSKIAGMPLGPVEQPIRLPEIHRLDLDNRFDTLLQWLEEIHPLAAMEVQRVVGGMFAFLIRDYFAPQYPVKPAHGGGLENSKQFIERHYRSTITVEQLAEIACCSKGYFLRAFKKAFDISPIAYQQRLRIQAAMTLLRYTEYPCKVVAQRVGYDDEYLFSKTFKKVTGMPPTEYRDEFLNQGRMEK